MRRDKLVVVAMWFLLLKVKPFGFASWMLPIATSNTGCGEKGKVLQEENTTSIEAVQRRLSVEIFACTFTSGAWQSADLVLYGTGLYLCSRGAENN